MGRVDAEILSSEYMLQLHRHRKFTCSEHMPNSYKAVKHESIAEVKLHHWVYETLNDVK